MGKVKSGRERGGARSQIAHAVVQRLLILRAGGLRHPLSYFRDVDLTQRAGAGAQPRSRTIACVAAFLYTIGRARIVGHHMELERAVSGPDAIYVCGTNAHGY